MTDPSTPASVHVRAPRMPDWVRRSKLAVFSLILASLPLFSWGACATGVLDPEDEGVVAWLAAAALAIVGAVLGIVSLVRLRVADPDERVSGRGLSLAAAVLGFLSPVISFVLGFATIDVHMNLGHGRALRRGRRLLRPRHVRTRDDVAALPLPHTPRATIRAVADAWRDSGAAEAASVVAFQELAAELALLGAPPDLVARAHDNAADEVRHAALCYRLAQAFDGRARGPAPLHAQPVAPRSLADFAAQNAIDSCVLEGAAALLARELATGDVDPHVRDVLLAIAQDEARHAEHGLDVVRWCVAMDPMARVACVDAVARFDIDRARAPAPDGLEGFGVAGPTLWRKCLRVARDDVANALELAPPHAGTTSARA